MPRDPTSYRPAFRSIADVKHAFLDLREAVRDRVAGIVGTAVADALSRTLRALLDDSPRKVTSSTRVFADDDYDAWTDETDDYDSRKYGCNPDRYDGEPPSADPVNPPNVCTALDAGYRAAMWCRSRVDSRWLATAAGTFVAAVTYLLGPLSAAVLPAVAALSLADRVCTSF